MVETILLELLQLSVAVGGVNVVVPVHKPGVVLMVTGPQVIEGGSLSFTVTVNEQVTALLLAPSVALRVTVVTPFWKVMLELALPLAIPETLAGLPLPLPEKAALQVPPGQLSAIGLGMVYAPVQSPVPLLSVVMVWLAGQVRVGGVVSGVKVMIIDAIASQPLLLSVTVTV